MTNLVCEAWVGDTRYGNRFKMDEGLSRLELEVEWRNEVQRLTGQTDYRFRSWVEQEV